MTPTNTENSQELLGILEIFPTPEDSLVSFRTGSYGIIFISSSETRGKGKSIFFYFYFSYMAAKREVRVFASSMIQIKR